MDIDKLKALALAATPGKWLSGYGEGVCGGRAASAVSWDLTDIRSMPVRVGDEVVAWLACYKPDDEEFLALSADAAFIAEANPATVLELIAEVERLRAAVEEAAAVFESGAKHNREQGRTVFAHAQQDRANHLRDVSGAHSKAGKPAQDDTNYDRAQLDALGKHGASQ